MSWSQDVPKIRHLRKIHSHNIISNLNLMNMVSSGQSNGPLKIFRISFITLTT